MLGSGSRTMNPHSSRSRRSFARLSLSLVGTVVKTLSCFHGRALALDVVSKYAVGFPGDTFFVVAGFPGDSFVLAGFPGDTFF